MFHCWVISLVGIGTYIEAGWRSPSITYSIGQDQSSAASDSAEPTSAAGVASCASAAPPTAERPSISASVAPETTKARERIDMATSTVLRSPVGAGVVGLYDGAIIRKRLLAVNPRRAAALPEQLRSFAALP